jgi:hypothetical protein
MGGRRKIQHCQMFVAPASPDVTSQFRIFLSRDLSETVDIATV